MSETHSRTSPARRPGRRAKPPGSPVATLLAVVLIVASVYLAKPVLVPICLAVLVSFILTPLVTLVQPWVKGRVPAVLIVVVAALCVSASVGSVVGMQVIKLAKELPDQEKNVQRKIQGLQSHGGTLSRLYQMVQDLGGQAPPATQPATQPAVATAGHGGGGDHAGPNGLSNNPLVAVEQSPLKSTLPAPPSTTQPIVTATESQSPAGKLVDYAGEVLSPIADAGLILILVIYLLIRREDMRNRMIGLLGHTRMAGTTRVTVETASRVSKLLLAQLCVNASFGFIFAIVLAIIGVPYVFLWGFITAILRFIPYIGTWLAASGPVLLSFAIAPGWAQPIAVFLSFLILDTVTANVIEPLLFGHSAGRLAGGAAGGRPCSGRGYGVRWGWC